MSFHKDLTGDSIHALTANTYADITARDADTAFQITANLDKMVRVNSPASYFILVSLSPTVFTKTGSEGFGDVVGPVSSTDNALTRFNGITGKSIQNSVITLSDLGDMSFPDNASLILGTGNDLTIKHDGTNSIITSTTGNLLIDNTNVAGITEIKLGDTGGNSSFEVVNSADTQLFRVTSSGLVRAGPLNEFNWSNTGKQLRLIGPNGGSGAGAAAGTVLHVDDLLKAQISLTTGNAGVSRIEFGKTLDNDVININYDAFTNNFDITDVINNRKIFNYEHVLKFVGIGTALPNTAFDLRSPQGANTAVFYCAGDTDATPRFEMGYAHTIPINDNKPFSQIRSRSTGELEIASRTNTPSSIKFYTTAVTTAIERMIIDSAGKIGIGRSPISTAQLTVLDEMNIATSAGTALGHFRANIPAGCVGIGSSQPTNFCLNVNNTERMRFHSVSKQVVIGDTSSVTPEATTPLSLINGGTGNSIFFGIRDAAGTRLRLGQRIGAIPTNSISAEISTNSIGDLTLIARSNFDSDIRFLTGNPTPTERMVIDVDGNVGIGAIGGTPNSTLEIQGSFAIQPIFGFGIINTDNAHSIYATDSVGGTTTYTIQTAHIVDGRIFIFYDETGNADTNNITIETQGSQLISGQTNYIIAVGFGWVKMIARAGKLTIIG